MKSKELRQKLGEVNDAYRKVVDLAHEEKRARTAEEETKLRDMDKDMDQLEKDIELADRMERRELTLAQPATRPAARPDVEVDATDAADKAQNTRYADYRTRFGRLGERIARRMADPKIQPVANKDYRAAFDKWITAPRGAGLSMLTTPEQRALSVGTAAEGGYTVPQEEWLAELIMEVDNQAVIRQIARTFQVTQAQSLGAPSLAADPSDPEWTTELSIGSEDSTMAFGKRELHPWPLAKYIKVSDKLLRASPLGMEEIVRGRLAYKVATAHSAAFNTGTGANQPLGLYVVSDSGIPSSRDKEIGNGSGAVDPDKLIDARYTLRPGYWPNARWHMHRNWLARFRKLKGSDNNYLWQPGLTQGAPGSLLDFPYVIDEYAPSVTTHGAGVYGAILGDFSQYWVVDALSVRLQRLDELFALTNQVGFVIRAETDAQPVLGDAFVRCLAAT